MKIKNLKINNFKGIKDLSIDLGGKDVFIYGDNATGKTTIFDAFTWLLFDKDSSQSKDFNIKPLNSDGEANGGIESIVEGVLEIDGKEVILKKVYYEKWTKQRGSAERVFSGNTTDYYIDEVPVKKTEYDNKIKSIADEKILRLLSNPLFFNQGLKWDERRKLVTEICGNVSLDDLCVSEPSLMKLKDVLGDRAVEEYKKIILARRKKINEDLEKIPVRIDEVNKNMPDVLELNFKEIEEEIKGLEATKEDLIKRIFDIKNGSQAAELKNKILELKSELLQKKNKYDLEVYEVKNKQINECSKAVSEAEKKLTEKTLDLYKIDSKITQKNKEIQELRDFWTEENKKQIEISNTCPTCGQDLPQSELEQTRKNFNLNKANKIERINADGKMLSEEVKQLTEAKSKLESEIAELKLKKDEAVKKYNDSLESAVPEFSETEDSKNIQDKIKENNEQIIDIESGSLCVIQELEEKNTLADNLIKELQEKFALREQKEKAITRISVLEMDQRKLAKDFEEAEEELFLIELYTKTHVKMLDEKINSKFKLAKFKLFEQQINGGISECCEVTYNGVPYSDLNNAMRINVGLDIINTLSDYYNLYLPIFIDNRESVTKLIDVNAQVVSLIVSEQDKNLRIGVK